MEDWIKQQANQFKMPPKGDNWEHIAAALDADTKARSKKRRVIILIWILPVIAFVLGYQYHKSSQSIALNQQVSKQELQATQQSKSKKPTSTNPTHLNNSNKSLSNKNIPTQLKNKDVKNTTPTHERKKQQFIVPSSQHKDNFHRALYTQSKVPSLIALSALNHPKPSPVALASNLKRPNMLQGLTVTKSNPFFVSSTSSLLDSIFPVLNPKKGAPSVYMEYALGSNQQCAGSSKVGAQNLFEITNSKLSQNTYQELQVGLNTNITPKLRLSLGVGMYTSQWNSYVGQRVKAQEGSIPYNSVISANPNPRFGLNGTGDTLYLQKRSTFNDYNQKELYAIGKDLSFKNKTNGLFIPLQLKWEIGSFKRISLHAQISSRFMLERKHDLLQFSEFQVYSREETKHSFLQLQSIQANTGLNFEYRIKQLGIYASPSFQFNAYQTKKGHSLSNQNLCRIKIGMGLNYYLQKAL